MKVVINADFGGFGLSHKAVMEYAKRAGLNIVSTRDGERYFYTYYLNVVSEDTFWDERSIERDDPILVQIVEELGGEAAGHYAALKVVEIPDDVDWYVSDYDGLEHVAEKHRTWS